MRAELLDQADAALGVAERHQVLAEQADAHRRAVRFGDLARQQRRDPVPRIALPIGVPGPTRVTSSLSSRDSMWVLLG